MIESKCNLVGEISTKQSLEGEVNNAIKYLPPVTQEKTVDSSIELQEIIPDKDYTGLSKVTINPVTSKIDQNIKAENIKEGVEVLGVTGIYNNAKEEQELIITPNFLEGNVEVLPDEGKVLNKVILEKSIDLEPENVKLGKTIFGIDGTNPGDDMSLYLKTNNFSKCSSNNTLANQTLLRFPDVLDLSGMTTLEYAFYSYKGEELPILNNTSEITSLYYSFYNAVNIKEIPQIDSQNINTLYYAFYGCNNLKTVGNLNTSKVTTMNSAFSSCRQLKDVSNLDFSSVTDLSSTFLQCSSLEYIPDFSAKVTTLYRTFDGCSKLKKGPSIDTSLVTSWYATFSSCKELEEIPQYDTSKATTIDQLFYQCENLNNIPELDFSSVKSVRSAFYNNRKLTTMGGLKDFGKGFSTTASANNYNYTISFSGTTLDYETGIRLLDKLYDIASMGVAVQEFRLPYQTLNALKATEEGLQAIANANAKGWSIKS